MLELLLARRANVNDKMPSGDGDRALHRAARVAGSVEMVERLLQCGAKIDALNQAKMTALGIAASSERWEIVRTLLEHGANANVASNRTPLHWAATTGNLEMVTLLLEKHAKVDAVDKEGQTPLQRAMRARHVEVVRELMRHRASLSARDQFGRTALHTAAASGTYELLQELVHEHGVDVASRSNDGSGALHYSCCWTDEADSTRMRETTRTLLALGCPVDLVTRSLHTPLHHHLRKSTTHSLPLVEDLVKARASVNARAQDGATPLHYAAQCDANVVAFLISSDAYIEARDVNDRTPIFYAAASCNEASCKVLLDYGADKYARDVRSNDRDRLYRDTVLNWSSNHLCLVRAEERSNALPQLECLGAITRSKRKTASIRCHGSRVWYVCVCESACVCTTHSMAAESGSLVRTYISSLERRTSSRGTV